MKHETYCAKTCNIVYKRIKQPLGMTIFLLTWEAFTMNQRWNSHHNQIESAGSWQSRLSQQKSLAGCHWISNPHLNKIHNTKNQMINKCPLNSSLLSFSSLQFQLPLFTMHLLFILSPGFRADIANSATTLATSGATTTANLHNGTRWSISYPYVAFLRFIRWQFVMKTRHHYMRVVLNSFIWKRPSSPNKNFLSPNFRELHVYLSRYMLAKILKKNMDVWYPQIVPGVWSLVTLHSAAAALKHVRSALRCWSLLTFIGQFWHNKSTV